MNKFDTEYLNDNRAEKLKKEQKTVRKTGIILLILAVVLMPIFSFTHFALVGVSGVLAVIGGILTARSYVHVKYQNIDRQK